jgi:hypothetical protein
MKKAVCLQIHTEEIQKKAEKNLVKLICDTFQVRICLLLWEETKIMLPMLKWHPVIISILIGEIKYGKWIQNKNHYPSFKSFYIGKPLNAIKQGRIQGGGGHTRRAPP